MEMAAQVSASLYTSVCDVIVSSPPRNTTISQLPQAKFGRIGSTFTSSSPLSRFGASVDEMKAVGELVKGKEIGLEELEGRANQAQIQKYKISSLELGISSLADAITCHIAARDAFMKMKRS